MLHFFDKSIKLAKDDAWADHQKAVHEPQTLLLDVFVAVLETVDDSVCDVGLVKSEFFSQVLKQDESCLPDWRSVVLVVLEWTEVDLHN